MGAALINSAKGVFLAAANDFDCDFVDVNSVIAGEIFADFTRLESRALDEGHKDVAAVLASAASELISGRPLRSVSAREIAEANQ